MSKENQLEMLCKGMIECGNRLIETANTLKNFYSSTEDAKEVKEEAVPTATEKKYTLEEVRAILSAKSKAGFREDVKALITKHGSDNLTKLEPNEYTSLVQEVEALSHE